MLGRLIGEGIVVETSLDPTLSPVEVDPGQMEQVVMNLAVNARDAMPQEGKLSIVTANVLVDEDDPQKEPKMTPGPYVLATVTDTGIGMDKETLARIFDPFFTTKGVGRGTGLGLSTVYGIVKQSGGHIYVHSEAGKGRPSGSICLPTKVRRRRYKMQRRDRSGSPARKRSWW